MSSDQNPPAPEWWKQPQDPDKKNQDSQATQQYPTGQGYQESQTTQRYPAGQRFPQPPGAPTAPEPQATPRYPAGQGYREPQDVPASQGFPGPQGSPGFPGPQGSPGFPADQGFPGGQGYQAYPAAQGGEGVLGTRGRPRRPRRRGRKWIITLIVVIVVLLVGDRVANAFTEDQMASQIQASLELSGKPKVSIAGFPFLTQLAARDFRTVNISASNETAGPGGQLKIASLTATLHGMHIHGMNSATIDHFTATALITFTAVADAGGIPQGITLSADGPNRMKASLDLGPLSESADVQITKVGPNEVNIKVIPSDSITSAILSNLDFNVTIPKLPAGVSIQSISVTQQGLQITASGTNTTVSQ